MNIVPLSSLRKEALDQIQIYLDCLREEGEREFLESEITLSREAHGVEAWDDNDNWLSNFWAFWHAHKEDGKVIKCGTINAQGFPDGEILCSIRD